MDTIENLKPCTIDDIYALPEGYGRVGNVLQYIPLRRTQSENILLAKMCQLEFMKDVL